MKTSNMIKIGAVMAVFIALALSYFFTPLGEYFKVEKIVELTEGIPQSVPVALLFLGLFFLGGALLTPIPLMAFAVSLVFDLWIAVLIAIPGFILASLSGYTLGRFIDTRTFGEKVEKHVDKIKKRVDKNGAWAVLALRVAPTPPFTITSMISGALQMNLPRYILGSTLGIAPLGLSAIFFGKGAIEMMQNPSGLAASSIVAAVALFTVYMFIKKKNPQT